MPEKLEQVQLSQECSFWETAVAQGLATEWTMQGLDAQVLIADELILFAGELVRSEQILPGCV